MSDTRQRLIEAYQKLTDITHPICAHKCNPPHNCCARSACERAIIHAKERWGVTLKSTGHKEYPLMGPEGCIAAPHLRPVCAAFVCIQQRKPSGYRDLLRDIHKLENKLTRELHRDTSPEAS